MPDRGYIIYNDRGQTRDRVQFPDPAAAPLGTDAEAGGAPASRRDVQRDVVDELLELVGAGHEVGVEGEVAGRERGGGGLRRRELDLDHAPADRPVVFAFLAG